MFVSCSVLDKSEESLVRAGEARKYWSQHNRGCDCDSETSYRCRSEAIACIAL